MIAYTAKFHLTSHMSYVMVSVDHICEHHRKSWCTITCFDRTDEERDQNKYKTSRELSEDQKHEIKEAFELFDTDKDQEIDYHELKVINFGF